MDIRAASPPAEAKGQALVLAAGSGPALPAVASTPNKRALLAEFDSATAAAAAGFRASGPARGVHLLGALVLCGLLLAWFLPIDRVVSAKGRIASQSPPLVVQPLETSIVRTIEVHEGQIVAAGELLLTLDPTFSNADSSQLEQKVASLEAELGRLEAELAGRAYEPAGPGVFERLQAVLAQARAAELTATLLRFDERIRGTMAVHERYGRDLGFRRPQLALLEEVEAMHSTLEAKQTGSRLKTLAARNNRIEVARELAIGEESLQAVGHELAALRAERSAYLENRRAGLAQELTERRSELGRVQEDLAKARKRHDLVELRAVEDAIVLQLGAVSVGAVLRSAEPAVTLIPLTAELKVEADIAGIDRAHVKPGDQVVVKLDAYRYARHGAIKGVIHSISGDTFTPDGATGSYYRAYVDIAAIELRDIPSDFRLVPGMPLEADIVVGKRTFAAYLLDGVLQPLNEGMREP